MSGTMAAGTLRGLPPPRPAMTAMYCRPSTLKLTGYPCAEVPRRVCQSDLAGFCVQCADVTIEIADEYDAACRRQRGRQERRALLELPHLLHRPHVIRRELAGCSLLFGRVLEQTIGSRTAATLGERHIRAR